MELGKFCIGGNCRIIQKVVDGEEKFFLEINASTDDIDLETDVISSDALRGAQHDLLKNNTVLEGHDRDKIAGSTVESEFMPPRDLRLLLLISNTRPDLQTQIRENALNKASIGGRILNFRDDVDPDTGQAIRIITRIRLHEVSLVSLPANQEARSLRWFIERSENIWSGDSVLTLSFLEDQHEGGDTEKMEKNKKGEGAGTPAAPAPAAPPVVEEVVSAFEFDESQLDEVGKRVEAEAQALVIREKMLHVTGMLKDHPDEATAKAGMALETLIGQLPIAGSSKSQGDMVAGKRLDSIEGMLRKFLSGEVQTPAVQTPSAPATQPGGRTTVIVRHAPRPGQGGAPAAGGDVVVPDAEIKAELAECKTFSQRLRILSKHGRLAVRAA